jgi:hypothetical protein
MMNKNTPVCTTPYLSIGSGPRPNRGEVGEKAHKIYPVKIIVEDMLKRNIRKGRKYKVYKDMGYM